MQLCYTKVKESKAQQKRQELQLRVTNLHAENQHLNYMNEKAHKDIKSF